MMATKQKKASDTWGNMLRGMKYHILKVKKPVSWNPKTFEVTDATGRVVALAGHDFAVNVLGFKV
jgi:hypothetical protein